MDAIDVVKILSISIPIISIFIEITPIKFNPISWLLKAIGSRFNKEIEDAIKDTKKMIKELDSKVDENEIFRLRHEILSFSNSCQLGERHTKDEFEHIIECNTRYHKILEERHLVNGKTDVEYNYIIKIYKKCIENHSFVSP